MSNDLVLIEEGEKKVTIGYDGDRLEFLITRNGYQWTGFEVDKQMLIMMRDAITKYLRRDFIKENLSLYSIMSLSFIDKYQELLMAVESKFPGESRHETALRYIKERENKTTISSEEEI